MKNYARYLEKLLQKGYAFMDYENQESDLSDEECIHYFNGINKSISSLGYCLSLEDITKFKHANIKTITKFYYMTYHTLSRAKGNHVRHSIFYKNFNILFR